MENGFDLMAALGERVARAGSTAPDGAIDWFALRARCAAAHAVRRELAQGESAMRTPAGGFALWAGLPLAPNQGSRVVNRTDLADGKVPSGMDTGITAVAPADGRGQQ